VYITRTEEKQKNFRHVDKNYSYQREKKWIQKKWLLSSI